jgi:hypothetical protein
MEGAIALLVVLLGAVAVAFGYGRAKGKASQQKQVETARREAAVAQERIEAAEVRREVDREIEQMPAESGPAGQSAADRLRERWSRD